MLELKKINRIRLSRKVDFKKIKKKIKSKTGGSKKRSKKWPQKRSKKRSIPKSADQKKDQKKDQKDQKKDQKIRKKIKKIKKRSKRSKKRSIPKSADQKKDQKDQKKDQLQKREFQKDQLVWSFGKRTYSKRSTSLIFRGTSLLQKINWLDLLVCPCRHHVQHPRLPGPPPEPCTATFPSTGTQVSLSQLNHAGICQAASSQEEFD